MRALPRCLVALALALAPVPAACGAAQHAGPVVIDCLAANRAPIEALILSFAPLIAGDHPDWSTVEQQAIAAGELVGGCALAEVVQAYLAPPPGRMAPAPAPGLAARGALEDFRSKHAGGAAFHTRAGDL